MASTTKQMRPNGKGGSALKEIIKFDPCAFSPVYVSGDGKLTSKLSSPCVANIGRSTSNSKKVHREFLKSVAPFNPFPGTGEVVNPLRIFRASEYVTATFGGSM